MYTGNKLSVSSTDSGLIELNFDASQGSVNVFNNDTVAEVTAALDVIDQQISAGKTINGMLVTSGKSVFVAGADITEFDVVFSKPSEEIKAFFNHHNSNLARIESFPFPSVVAINGFALGGGLEFCLACDYRVMSSAARVGLPETTLGLIPGWGGTVRTPRLIGLETALAWIASGAHQNADSAKKAGLVAEVAEPENLRAVALSVLNDAIANPNAVEQIRSAKSSAMSVSAEDALTSAQAVKAKVCARQPQLAAPAGVIDMMAVSCRESGEVALQQEADLFAVLSKNAQARAMVGNFLNDQYIKKVAKTYARNAQLTLDKASVVGAGIMGGGIAYQNALKAIPVVMKDIAEPALEQGMAEANKLLSKRVSRGRMTDEKKSATLELIKPTLEDADMDGSKVIVEAVVENPAVKESVLAALENNLAEGGILVSNTSTISISRLAKALKKSEQFAGLHFFNPVHAMPLVEVVRGEKTSDQTISDLVAYSLALGKQPIVVNDCPAFLVNRVLFPFYRGFEQLVCDSVDFQRIDQVMQDWGWPMGPAYLADVIGIDTLCHCTDVLAEDFPDRMSQLDQSVLKALDSAERYGQKNGKGFYQYQADDKGRPQRTVDDESNGLIAECQTQAIELTDEEIEMRCMLPMAIEMARCLEEGIVDSPAEADMALLMGLGFPSFRGGVVRWMDEVGIAEVCRWADGFASQLGAAYEVTNTMREMAVQGKTYY